MAGLLSSLSRARVDTVAVPPDNARPFVALLRHARLQCGDAVGSDGGV